MDRLVGRRNFFAAVVGSTIMTTAGRAPAAAESDVDASIRVPTISDAGLQFPVNDITNNVFGREWPNMVYPESWPYTADDMRRIDETDDAQFYGEPRFVYHIDLPAVAALRHYYATTIVQEGLDLLDICSSWTSHYPDAFPARMGRISGSGMNYRELKKNPQLDDFAAADLNRRPVLPYPDASFDVVTCVVSVDYLIHPVEVRVG